MAATLREQGTTVPFIFMGYYNPILAFGERAFCSACYETGVDGLIVPDLPPGEGESLAKACREHGLAQIYLLPPTSPPDRVRIVTAHSQGFVYLVSVTGVTGARDRLPAGLAAFILRVRAATGKPLAVGFGISSPEQAALVAAIADGVIVGSALLLQAAGADGVTKVRAFVADLRRATVRD
jgi:tryptophan synthase alpha chain